MIGLNGDIMAQKKTTAKSTAKKSTAKKTTSGKKTTAKNKSTKSTKSTGRKTSSKNSYEDEGMMDEVISLIVIAISIVALISLFTDKIGIVGEVIGNVLRGLFGLGGYFLPFLVIAFCVWMLFSEERRGFKLKIGASVLFIVCMASFAHAISSTGQGTLTVSNLYSSGAASNGGAVGGIIGGTMVKYFDKLGTYIILSVLIIVSIVLGTGMSFFGGVENAARYVGDTGRRRDEKKQVKAEKAKAKEEEKEIRQAEQAQKARKRKEVFNILMDKNEFDAGESGGFANGTERVSKQDEVKVEAFSDGVMPSDYMVRNIARHTGTAKPEMDIKDDDAQAMVEFNKERGIQCVISNGSFADEDELDTEPAEFEMNSADNEPAFDLEEVSDEEIEREGLNFNMEKEEPEEKMTIEMPEEEPGEAEAEKAEEDEEVITSGASKEGYMPEKPMEEPTHISGDIIGGDILTEDEKRAVTGVDDTKPQPKEIKVKTDYKFPPISLLGKDPMSGIQQSKQEMLATAQKLEDTLRSFGVEAKVMQINQGPTVTRYELSPSHGVKVSKIVSLADDIALNLAASGIRIEAPIPGKAAVGIEVPNKEQQSVYLRTVLESDQFKNFPSKLAFALGQDIAGNAVVTDIAKMPHLLIAGATGSGKSVCINTLITSIIYKAKPDEVKLILIDPKVVELNVYNGIPHLMIPVVTDPKKAAGALNWAVREMLARYNLFAENLVRDINGYNAMKTEKGETDLMPKIVIIIDELADLMMASPKEVEDSIQRLAQMARAAGIHLIIATQRPSVDVITGVIKANIPSRMAFAVSSGVDSRTILDMVGAEKLLGKGDMLFYPTGMSKPVRIQGAFVTDKEVESIVEFLKEQNKENEYNQSVIEEISSSVKTGSDGGEKDEFFDAAIDLIVSKEKASVSMLQRQFRIGYNRAARLMDELEDAGIVGPEDGSKPRKVLIDRNDVEEYRGEQMN